MSWCQIKRACGHTEGLKIDGPSRHHEYLINRLEAGLCEACRKEAGAERRAYLASDEAANRARELSEETGYVKLEGTVKQVAWAAEIRNNLLVTMRPEDRETLGTLTSASWWIEHRNGFSLSMIAKNMRAGK